MIIYKTVNLINGKFYIGQDSKNNPDYLGSGFYLNRAIKKYGKENFKKTILEYCSSKDELNKAEIYWIEHTNAIAVGYNIACGGQGGNLGDVINKRKSKSMKDYINKNPGWVNGKNNPRYDTEMYHFYNYVTDEEIKDTKFNAADKIGTSSKYLHQVILGNRKHHKNWILFINKDIYTEEYFIKQKSEVAKNNRSHVKIAAGPTKGSSWWHNHITNEQKLCVVQPKGYIKGKIK